MTFEEWWEQHATPNDDVAKDLAKRAWTAANACNDYLQTNAALRSQVISVAYIDVLPTVKQGYPSHELEEVLTARDAQGWVRSAARVHALRQALGFIDNASDTFVRIFQDDATRDFIVKVGTGGDWYHGPSLEQALDQLVQAVSEGKYAD